MLSPWKAIVFCSAVLWASLSQAAEIQLLELTVYEGDEVVNTVSYSFKDLERLANEIYITKTPWTKKPEAFKGPKMETLIKMHKPDAQMLVAYAVDGYFIEFDTKELIDNGAILAKTRNGKPMRVRDRGPLWVIYPWADEPRLRTESIYTRSIWQTTRIELR